MTAAAFSDLICSLGDQRLQIWLISHAHLLMTWSHAFNEAVHLFQHCQQAHMPPAFAPGGPLPGQLRYLFAQQAVSSPTVTVCRHAIITCHQEPFKPSHGRAKSHIGCLLRLQAWCHRLHHEDRHQGDRPTHTCSSSHQGPGHPLCPSRTSYWILQMRRTASIAW